MQVSDVTMLVLPTSYQDSKKNVKLDVYDFEVMTVGHTYHASTALMVTHTVIATL